MEDYIKKLKSGDEKAFERAVLENQEQVYSVCVNMLKNIYDAQDAAQETFIKAYRSLAGFNNDSSVSTWLTRIAINTCLDILRKRKDVVSFEDISEPADEETPEAASERTALRMAVRAAVAELAPDMRAAVTLRDIEGLSYAEAAQILGINEGTLKSRLFRARERLKKILAEKAELF